MMKKELAVFKIKVVRMNLVETKCNTEVRSLGKLNGR